MAKSAGAPGSTGVKAACGTPLKEGSTPSASIIVERIKAKVRVNPETGCHEWQGAKIPRGYGKMQIRPRMHLVHRLVYEMSKGDIPEGMFVCHACDNRGCVNPDHLFLGSHVDNMQDMTAKGRQAKGEGHPDAELTEDQVREIIASKESIKALMERYGRSRACISLIRHRKRWKHVDQTPPPARTTGRQGGRLQWPSSPARGRRGERRRFR